MFTRQGMRPRYSPMSGCVHLGVGGMMRVAGLVLVVQACVLADQPASAPTSQPAWQSLFNGGDLAGWHVVGGARWAVAGGEIVGQTGDGSYGWLVTDRPYDDFVFEFECRHEVAGNSGIQFRSHVVDGVMYGYQAEFDPRPEHGTGGVYEQGGRGWLHKPDARGLAAMKPMEWNRYRIRAVGDRIQLFVNDVPTVDFRDTQARGGIIALQIHSGQQPMTVRWRNLRIKELSEGGAWMPIFDGRTLKGWHTQGEPDVWRVEEKAIVGELAKPSPYAYLVTDASFGDFELKLQMRYETNSGNSGVFFWSTFPPQCAQCGEVVRGLPRDVSVFKCPKCGHDKAVPLPQRVHIHGPQAEFAPPKQNTGGLYDARIGRWINEGQFNEMMHKMHRFEEWNELRIIAAGRDVLVYLNGYRVGEVRGYDFPEEGQIALQLHSGDAMRVRFKDLQVRRLGS